MADNIPFFSNLFASSPSPAATDLGADTPTQAPTPGEPNVLQSLQVPGDAGNVTIAIALSTSSFNAKDLEERGLTYAQVADLAQSGCSSNIGTYTVVGSNGGQRTVNGSDKFTSEDATVGEVARIDTTPSSSGDLG